MALEVVVNVSTECARAPDHASIQTLIDLCHAGQLFEVQQWISQGNPVNGPPPSKRKQRPRSPLEVAIDRGFHSLVKVLLEGGAIQEPDGYEAPIYRAIKTKRSDIAQLLVEYGFDPTGINMHEVLDSWEPRLMEFFVARGADLHHGRPFAAALCKRIRTALGIYKRLRAADPAMQEQGNIALRHHCGEGNLKWVSLMLWAGADPYSRGHDHYEDPNEDEGDGYTALALAALHGHFEIFDLKPIRTTLPGPNPFEYLRYLTRGKGVEILHGLLEKGLKPNDQSNGGCSVIQSCLEQMSWTRVFAAWLAPGGNEHNLDSAEARDRLKAIYILASHGARWCPCDKAQVDAARRSLLQMTADYSVEFIWIMAKFKACSRSSALDLLRTPSIKARLAPHRSRVEELLDEFSVRP